ncbi:nitroreductase [bacterium CPR1]|nr:nitroreductase [bacterium CPR1]
MPLEQALRTQRALRRLKTDPVEEELLLHLLDLAIRAPSGSNAQGWEFVVVRERETMARLARLNRQAFSLFRLFKPLAKMTPTRQRMFESARWQADHFEEIPALIIPCLKQVIWPFPFLAATSAFGSIYPAVQNLLLGARAAGLGAALITIPLWNLGAVRRAVGLPWRVTPCCLIPLGWPLEEYTPNRRRPVREVVSFERYGRRL